MILPLHILIALTSIIVATYSYVSPSINTLRASYGLIALTLGSGTVLALSAPGHMLQACVSGIVYVTVVMALVIFARRKLAQTS